MSVINAILLHFYFRFYFASFFYVLVALPGFFPGVMVHLHWMFNL